MANEPDPDMAQQEAENLIARAVAEMDDAEHAKCKDTLDEIDTWIDWVKDRWEIECAAGKISLENENRRFEGVSRHRNTIGRDSFYIRWSFDHSEVEAEAVTVKRSLAFRGVDGRYTDLVNTIWAIEMLVEKADAFREHLCNIDYDPESQTPCPQ